MANFTAPNTEQLAVRIRARLDAALRAAKAEAYQFGEEVMADSKANYVPVDTGLLRSSGFVQTEDRSNSFQIILGYGGAASGYAIHVHENLNSHHEPPTQAKYLELPFRAAAPKFPQRIADAARGAMRQ